ncbi:hypothetical protein [Methylobacterium sp. A54F]
MSPTETCLRKVSDAARIADSTLIGKLTVALDELEAAYPIPSERIVALETVFQDFTRRRRSTHRTPFARLLRVSIERRQIRCSRRAA